MWGTKEQDRKFGSIWKFWYGPKEDRDRSKAVKFLKPLADGGHIPSVCCLGEAYFNGEGVRRNYKAAFDLHSTAAEKGCPSSECQIGNFYIMASPKQDACEYGPEESAKWYKLAANHGNSSAQFNLAFSYEQGRGTEVSFIKAFIWASLAVHCSHLRFRPAEVLRDKAKSQISESELIESDERFMELCNKLPLPWSEHLVYWKKLASETGVIE